MKTTLRFVVAAVAALLLIAATPGMVPAGGHVQVRVADGDVPGGG
jgi:hypothetical protein